MPSYSMSQHARTIIEHAQYHRFDEFFKGAIALKDCPKDFSVCLQVFTQLMADPVHELAFGNFRIKDIKRIDGYVVAIIHELLSRDFGIELATSLLPFLSEQPKGHYARMCQQRMAGAINSPPRSLEEDLVGQ